MAHTDHFALTILAFDLQQDHVGAVTQVQHLVCEAQWLSGQRVLANRQALHV